MSAGFISLGQFVGHDITFDPALSLERQNGLKARQKFQNLPLELAGSYGAGWAAAPWLSAPKIRSLF